MAYCEPCDTTHATDDVRVAGTRFTTTPKYAANIPGAPIRNTREEAAADLCEHTQEQT